MKPRKNRSKISKLQKRIQCQEIEKRELLAEIRKCREDAETQAKLFEEREQQYKSKISTLIKNIEKEDKKSRSSTKMQVYNWIIFGVMFAFMPLAYQVLFSEMLGYNMRLSEILPDYMLVIFALSGNLLSIIFGSRSVLMSLFKYILIMLALFSLSVNSIILVQNMELIENTINTVFLFACTSFIIICIISLGILIIRIDIRHT